MRRSLRARITFALAAVILALVVVAASAMVSLTRLGGAIDTILRENYRSVVACDAMNEALERLDSAALFAASGRDDIARTLLDAHRARFEAAFRVEAGNITLAAEAEAVRDLDARYRAYGRAVDEALALTDNEARRAVYFRALLPRSNPPRGRSPRRSARSSRRRATTPSGCAPSSTSSSIWCASRPRRASFDARPFSRGVCSSRQSKLTVRSRARRASRSTWPREPPWPSSTSTSRRSASCSRTSSRTRSATRPPGGG